MFDTALAAQRLVFEAARPYEPRDSAKAKMRRAEQRLEANGLRHAAARVERAWKGRAGPRIFVEIKTAFDRWQRAALREADRKLIEQFARFEEAVNASGDPDFYRPHLEAMRSALSLRRNGMR